MEKEYSKISPTAYLHAYYRTLYDLPYAKEIAGEINAEKKFREFLGEDPRLAPIFEARYKGTDRIIRKYIRENDIRQILEIAAGLSTEGLILSGEYPNISYIETDLPEMVEMKGNIVENILEKNRDNLYFRPANVLDLTDLQKATTIFDPSEPVIIASVGLLSYLNSEERLMLAMNMRDILSEFGGVWITPDPAMHNQRRREMYGDARAQQKVESKIAEKTGRSYEENAFENEKAADEFFTEQGFAIKKFSQLDGYKLISPEKTGLDEKSGELILENIRSYGKVWVLSLE